MPLALILIVVALVLFVLAALGVGGRISLTPAGLACITLAALIGELPL